MPQYVPGDKLPMGTTDVTLYAVWGVKEGTVSLTYHSNFGTDQASTESGLANNSLVTVKSYGETGLPARVGYTFQGWSTAPSGSAIFAAGASARVNADGSNDLYAVWAPNANTGYTVEFYYMNDDNSYPGTPNQAASRTGTTDATVSVTAADKADKENGKYTYDAAAANVESATLSGDGSTVLKLYFKLNTAQYTIHHYLLGTTVSVAADQTGTQTIGTQLTAGKSDALYPEYAAAVVSSYAPSQTITIGVSGNVITAYYTVPLTLTANDASKVYDGAALTQPEFTAVGLVNGDTATLAMTAESTITNVGSQTNVIDQATVKVNGGAIPGYYTVTYYDGTLTVTQAKKEIVVIKGNTDTKVYNGTEQTVTGFEVISNPANAVVTLAADKAATASGTNVGKYFMGLTAADFTATSPNYEQVEVQYTDGLLEITPVTDEIIVTITGNHDTKVYNGSEQSVTGYTTDVGDKAINVALKEGHTAEAKGTDVDIYPMGLTAADFTVTSDNYSNITVVVIDGYLEITPVTDEITVTVTGNTGSFHYDEAEHTVTGYTVKISDLRYTENDFKFSGVASVSGTEPGDYLMGLKAEDFANVNGNFTNVKFVVKDGWLNIFTEKFRVAWLYDTNQMINSGEPSDKFSAITKFIERNDMRLVLHTGNVVDNAADESQWKVFNDAMQKIYDAPRTDTLMVSGEKEIEEGSLFLQQPIWDEFKEEDLFEGGKGFVYRFFIGNRRMILVGLGEDAMTEEGYKWAKERFDSDPYAAGILMVHTYLLDDMTKEQKIADSALELEEKVVKPCSNVHMVFSSNAGYASHHSFFYGNRKTTAINVDIEAAAKEGYFTMLTFDADLHSLSVTSVSPIKNDWIYNEEKFDLECYNVLGVY